MYSDDIAQWVEKESQPKLRPFRQAVHTVLIAISRSADFKANMIIKGGILLAIRYNSTRFTKDIDFSTELMAQDFKLERFIEEFNSNLIGASEQLDYGLSCKVQSHRMNPPSPEASFPTLELKVGYAYKDEINNYKKLQNLKSPHVVSIDYSFNEVTQEVELLRIDGGGEISAYSLTDLIAEKYRAIIQQETRNRFRRQDVYDLHFLLTKYSDISRIEKLKVLKSLISKAASRNIAVDKATLSRDGIISRSKKDYNRLQLEIIGELPDFEESYKVVRAFYESLPWTSGGI
jgi:predicted nucleotidyltransferase component of viral defense system